MVNLFIFFLSLSLSLIRPGVFCSIYHLDETLPQFINALYRHTRSILFTAFLINTHTIVSGKQRIPTQTYSLINFFSTQKGKKLPILFVSFLIITFLCLSRFMSCQKLPANMSWRSPAMLSVYMFVSVYVFMHLCVCACAV